jgi:hypothetical protein
MDKNKHKYNTRSTSGKKNIENDNQEMAENPNLNTTASNFQNQDERTVYMEEPGKNFLSKHINKKRALRESAEMETEQEISNVVKPGPSASYYAEPKSVEILDESVDEDNLYYEGYKTVVKTKKKNKRKDKVMPVEVPKSIPPKVWRKECGIKLLKVFIEAEKIKGNSLYAKILKVKSLLFQNQIDVIFGKIETTNKEKKIVIYLSKEEDVQSAKKVNLGDTEHHIHLQEMAEILPNEYENLCKWKIWDIPLYVKRNDLLMHLNRFGKVKQLHLITKNMWQLAHVEFENEESSEKLSAVWSIWIGTDCLRITPGNFSYEELNDRGNSQQS